MRTLRRAVHFDFHTMPGVPDLGADFSATGFAKTLKDAHVDYVNVFAKCNIGFAYYPTDIGQRYPGLDFDMLGETIAACHEQGIGVTAYFNVGLDHEMARQHRDWTVVNVDGQVIYGDRTKNFFRTMCIRSPWRSHVLGMIREVIDRYPDVDGIFLDCIGIRPCYGNECLEGIAAAGDDPLDTDAVRRYAEDGWVTFCQEVKEIVGPDRFLVPNGLPWNLGDGLRTHGEIECLPGGSWGYDFFPARVAYSRNIDPQVLYMTGRFNTSWGGFGELKTEASIRNDCWDAIANAAQPSIGDHLHPRGHLEQPVYDLVRKVYADVEALEPWTLGARAYADIGVLAAPDRSLSASHSGAARMLGELHQTFDIVDDRHDLSGYRMLVLPDHVTLDGDLADKVSDYVAAGGPVLSTGWSGLRPDREGFALSAWALNFAGPEPSNSSYFMTSGAVEGVPEMPTAVAQPGILVDPSPGAELIAERIEAYADHVWDGFHGYFYTPPAAPTGHLAAAQVNSVVQIAFPLFSAYLGNPLPAYRALLRHCVDRLLPEPMLRTEGIPPTARVTLTRQPGRTMCHVKLTHPEPRGSMHVVEGYPTLIDGTVTIRATPKRVYLAPDQADISFRQESDHVVIDLPRIDGYALVVLED